MRFSFAKASLTVLSCCLFCATKGQDSVRLQNKYPDSVNVAILNEVVVSASRVKEKLLQSPVHIQKAGEKYFHNPPAPAFFDALENVQGVQMITPSLGFKVINARGFANTTNVRFAQLVDGMDMQSPHIGAPIGNALGPTGPDIDAVEIIPGVASALYGMNTINGLAAFTTKHPSNSEGLSIQQKTGLTHFGDSKKDPTFFSETSLRWAKVVSPKFSFKINGSFSKGYDWIATITPTLIQMPTAVPILLVSIILHRIR